jgi:glycosyltransferase involved in cell wall biosynthesis
VLWEFYCSNSPSFVFDGDTPYQRGVGGAELGLITVAETLAERGHEVYIYNTPPNGMRVVNGVNYIPIANFDTAHDKHDVFVLFRNPMPDRMQLQSLQSRRKIFWSTDQMTAGNYATDIIPFVDSVITISPYHTQYFKEHYHCESIPIDLPVRLNEYDDTLVERDPFRLLYCSVPDRGLQHLLRLFPQIREEVPQAKLWVTSDYSLWGEGIAAGNDVFKRMANDTAGVEFLGKVPREQLIDLQKGSSLMAYPNANVCGLYELFCISAAECQVAGAIPITSMRGGLATTVMGGVLIDGEPGVGGYDTQFVQAVVALLSLQSGASELRTNLMRLARNRFDPETVVDQWLRLVA